jgi:hypothetical protein
MAKKNKIPQEGAKNLNEVIAGLKAELQAKSGKKPVGYIPSIIEFVESPDYLGFTSMNLTLRPMQRIILKCFYRGSIGNEHISLDQEETDLLKRVGCDTEENGNIIEKWNNNEVFRELVLVWGRRSGKDFLVSIIALYEAMKLIEAPGGDPYKQYNLANAAPFTILTIANSQEQAAIAYREIYQKLIMSNYFKDKVMTDGITQDRIFLLTPQDVLDNEVLAKKGLKPKLGSVLIRIGHSDSNTLVGIGCYVLIFDEIGLYPNSTGPSSGDNLYGNLVPTVKTYVRRVPVTDEQGNPVYGPDGKQLINRIFDGKVICISSPRAAEGIFYRLYATAIDVPHRLMCRLPSWVVNTDYTEESLRSENPEMIEAKFDMEYGAIFSGTAGESFFPREIVERCFREKSIKLRDFGQPGKKYFAHLDPATSSHNYALVVVHPEYFINKETKKQDCVFILDHIKYWTPQGGMPINVHEIDEYMINLNKRFRLAMVTYDQWNSALSIQKLRKIGMPAKLARFTAQYKVQIYDNFEQVATSGRLLIPSCEETKLLKFEMFNLQKKYTTTGYKVYPKKEGEILTDDICDALAGALFNIANTQVSKLPQGKLANTPVIPGGSNQVWRSMQGVPYGYGSGEVVAKQLERRAAWPYYKR